jgi:hypothetical protein
MLIWRLLLASFPLACPLVLVKTPRYRLAFKNQKHYRVIFRKKSAIPVPLCVATSLQRIIHGVSTPQENDMWRERALRIVLILFGLLFTAGLYPIVDSLRHADQKMYTDDMMLSLYVALGIFLLIASRNPLPTAA